MGFVLKQISDVGSSNPIVARLLLQFGEIIEFYNLPKDVKDDIKDILHSDIQKRLLACDKILVELNNEINDVLKTINEGGLKTQSQGRVLELPQIIRLEERLESYLYNAKSCLRDVLKIYNVVFDAGFNEARYDKAIVWASEKFGENDHLTNFLRADHDLWIHKIVKMRNAIEHPGGHSGHLNIINFEVNLDNIETKILEPMWHLNDEVPTIIRHDLSAFTQNALELTEDVVISALEKKGKPPMFELKEIPEDQRREEAPIRFKMGIANQS